MLRFAQDDIHDIVGYKNVTRKARVYPLILYLLSLLSLLSILLLLILLSPTLIP